MINFKMEWKNIPMCIYRHTWFFCLYPKLTGQKSGRGCQSDPVDSRDETQALSICYTPLCWLLHWQIFGGRRDMKRHTPAVYCTEPLIWRPLQQGWSEKKPWLCLRNQRQEKGIIWGRKAQLAQVHRLDEHCAQAHTPAPPRCSSARNSTNVVLQLPGQSCRSYLHLLSIKGVILLPQSPLNSLGRCHVLFREVLNCSAPRKSTLWKRLQVGSIYNCSSVCPDAGT